MAWHLVNPPNFGPLASGYEEFFGPMSGSIAHFSHADSSGRHDLFEGLAESPTGGYLTDLISTRAVDWRQRMSKGDAPFFLSLHDTAAHWPWETHDDLEVSKNLAGSLLHLSGSNIFTRRHMIHHTDEGIGQLLQALRQTGRLDNTLAVFTHDNGGERFSDSWPLVGGKMDLSEGGVRLPYIVQWPARVAAAGVSAQHCLTMDGSATLLDAAGVRAHADHPLDVRSLLPVLQDPGKTTHRPMSRRMNQRDQRAHRDGRWKHLRVDGHDYLFDITQNERERANQGGLRPPQLQGLRRAGEAWNGTMPTIARHATVSPGPSVKDMPQR